MFNFFKKTEPTLKSYDYCDIDLFSKEISTIKSREQIVLHNMPLIAAPMVDVIGPKNFKEISSIATLQIAHRFQSKEDQLEYYQKERAFETYFSIGVSKNDLSRFLYLSDHGVRRFCIDVANGANSHVVKFCESINAMKNDLDLIVGNVQSYEQYVHLAKNIYGLFGVRLGVASGNGCSTKNATGIRSPHVTSLLQFKDKPRINKVNIIADGGIREPGDFCKAIALGADYVMAGSIFAACSDSPAKKIKQGDKEFAIFSGSASKEIQKTYKKELKYIEGKTIEIPVNNMTSLELIKSYKEGLLSSMSYFGASDIEEYKKKVFWLYKS